MIAFRQQLNISTCLTLARLILSPLILPVLLVSYLPLNQLSINIILAIAFGLFSLTDFFDGYLARKYCQETLLGKILDPIADKFLVYSTLVALLAIGKIYYYWVIVLIGREFFVMALRMIALEYQMRIAVSYGGKVKTVAQMALLIFLIINPAQSLGWSGAPEWNILESCLIAITLALSVYSAWDYYRSCHWSSVVSSIK